MIRHVLKRVTFLFIVYSVEILCFLIPLFITANSGFRIAENNNEIVSISKVYDEVSSVDEIDYSSMMNMYREELESYISGYNLSLKYYNLSDGYSLQYNGDAIYYSASTLKLIDVSYIYDNKIDLNTIINVSNNSSLRSSECLSSFYNNGTIRIKDALVCLISYSDNYAHHILVDYFNYNQVLSYNKSLGTTYTITDGDYLGNINLEDAFIYMKKVSILLENNEFLQGIFDNQVYNFLNTSEINYYHKYGMYGTFYHDLGISISDDPYILIILSKERNNISLQDIYQKISQLIYIT